MPMLFLLIVAGLLAESTTAAVAEQGVVFSCDFGSSWDQNYDGWPDGWTRRRGKGYPHYVSIDLAPASPATEPPCLRIALDGGGGAALSPPIAIDALHAYAVEARVQTRGLHYSRAFLSLTFLDAERAPLAVFRSSETLDAPTWTPLSLGPVACGKEGARWAVVGLHLEPTGRRQDLTGGASFAAVRVLQSPRMILATHPPGGLFQAGETVEIRCRVVGWTVPQTAASLTLLDVHGLAQATTEQPFEQIVLPAVGQAAPAAGDHSAEPTSSPSHEEKQSPVVGESRWQLPPLAAGYYRVRAQLPGAGGLAGQQEISLVVLGHAPALAGSEFGWTLPRECPLAEGALERLVAQAGIGRIKLPLWYGDGAADRQALERTLAMAQRFDASGIEVVGLLADPPATVRKGLESADEMLAADVFALEPQVWQASLRAMLSAARGRIAWWQLGRDDDTSFAGLPAFADRVETVRTSLEQGGQKTRLGIGWNWLIAWPAQTPAACDFLNLSSEPPLTDEELAAQLDALPAGGPRRWVTLRPLPRHEYSVDARAEDLTRRILAAKIHQADAVFCPTPFDSQCGLMNADGTPGELFPVWRTATTLLAGAQCIGRLELPAESPNLVFARGDEVLMVVWNPHPTVERLYLGDHVATVSLWGAATSPAAAGDEQTIEVGPQPVFVTGLHGPIARLRIALALERAQIPSTFGLAHPNSLRLTNPFPHVLEGRAALAVPAGWNVRPRPFSLGLAPGETRDLPFTITLPLDASSGRHPLRIDFVLDGDQSRPFSVYRHLQVGLGEVYIEVATRLNREGELEIESRLVNDTDERVNFRCQLFAPDRQRQKIDVLDLGRGRDVRTFHLDRGRELLGKPLWLRAEELGGVRVLNYRFTAKEAP